MSVRLNRHTFFLTFLLVFGILLSQGASAQRTTDSLFLVNSHPVIFKVNRTEIQANDAKWITDSLMPQLEALGENAIILGRSAASPEGPLRWNHQLAIGRRDALVDFLHRQGFDATRICFDVADEEYELLVEMMRQRHDPDYERVRNIVEACDQDFVRTKALIKALSEGETWNRLYREYYPTLRAVRIMAYEFEPQFTLTDRTIQPFDPVTLIPHIEPAVQPQGIRIQGDTGISYAEPDSWLARREWLSVRTNLLEWAAYVPQYGFCPMPNVAIEYYPRHGHWTFGASLDFPWWIGNTTNHKYFELNNYQLEARYYFRNSDRSYSDAELTLPKRGAAAFRGWYMQANAHAFLYQIGFTAKKGWIGEGLGAGLGAGYVMPLTRDQHWRLDFGFQVGYFRTQYDPFVYGKPVYHGGEIDGHYYYNTPLYRKDFVKRQHLYSWFGPTRVGITLSYDLLYRRHSGKRPSFSKWEKGDAL